jgi:hypothetical protein
MEKNSKFSERDTRIIAAQLIVAKGLEKDPINTINFIRCNRKYFQSITDEMLEMLMKENHISHEDLDNCSSVKIADY